MDKNLSGTAGHRSMGDVTLDCRTHVAAALKRKRFVRILTVLEERKWEFLFISTSFSHLFRISVTFQINCAVCPEDLNARAFYRPRTGEVTVCCNHVKDEKDLKNALLHEFIHLYDVRQFIWKKDILFSFLLASSFEYGLLQMRRHRLQWDSSFGARWLPKGFIEIQMRNRPGWNCDVQRVSRGWPWLGCGVLSEMLGHARTVRWQMKFCQWLCNSKWVVLGIACKDRHWSM